MTTKARVTIDSDTARDGIFFVAPKSIEPDPEQPRVDVDAELADSIREHGVLQAITVRPHPDIADAWMIVDGERRWRGAMAAKLKEMPVAIRMDLEDRAERLLVQLASNTGRPLTPFEEAEAWADIMELKGWTQVELAKSLNVPRTTVGDRMRLRSVAAFWRDLMKKGVLQLSHAPALAKYSIIPEKWQPEIWDRMRKEDYQLHADVEEGAPPSVRRFADALERAIKSFTHPLFKTQHGDSCVFDPKLYEGPVIERDGKRYAADPDLFRPLVRKARAEKAKKNREARENGEQPRDGRHGQNAPAALKLPDTIAIFRGRASYVSAHDSDKGKRTVWFRDNYNKGGWYFPYDHNGRKVFDVETFLAHVDHDKVWNEVGSYQGCALITCDDGALGRARSVYLEKRQAFYEARIDELRAVIESTTFGTRLVWDGAPALLQVLLARDPEDRGRAVTPLMAALHDVAYACRIETALDKVDRVEASRIVEGLALGRKKPFPSVAIAKWDEEYLKAQERAPIKFADPERPPKAKDVDPQPIKAALEKEQRIVASDETRRKEKRDRKRTPDPVQDSPLVEFIERGAPDPAGVPALESFVARGMAAQDAADLLTAAVAP